MLTFYADPQRFIASGGKLDTSYRYVFYDSNAAKGFTSGRTCYTKGGDTFPGLNISGVEVTRTQAAGGVGWSTIGLSI